MLTYYTAQYLMFKHSVHPFKVLTLSHTALDAVIFSWNARVYSPDLHLISQLLSVYNLPCQSR